MVLISRNSKTAVIVVDATNDFVDENGALPAPDGPGAIRPINSLIKRFTMWIFTRDVHDPRSAHFTKGGWKLHGIPGTWGFEFFPELDTLGGTIVNKGMSLEDDGYSGFEGVVDGTDVTLANYLRANSITHVIVVGYATDYCVRATALDAVKEGFSVFLAVDACRAINVCPGDEADAIAEMRAKGVVITTTEELSQPK